MHKIGTMKNVEKAIKRLRKILGGCKFLTLLRKRGAGRKYEEFFIKIRRQIG